MVSILVRLGLGYTLAADNENVFIPALIQDKHTPTWFSGTGQASGRGTLRSWVLGFSLTSKDSLTTLLPVTVLRKLQVELAQDEDIGRRVDSEFRAATSRIWFKWEGMGFLVEYYGDPMNSEDNVLDILVKPVTENNCESDGDVKMERRKQITLAQMIVDRALDVASDCPGLELKRSVIHPWVCSNGFVALEHRKARSSVEKMMDELRRKIESRSSHGQENDLWTTNWIVGGKLVEYEDVLGVDDWRNVAGIFQKRCELTEVALERLQILEPTQGSQHEGNPAAVELDSDNEESLSGMSRGEETGSANDMMLRRIWSELKAIRRDMHQRFDYQGKEMHQRFDNLGENIQGATERLRNVLKLQDRLNKDVQSLEAFTIMEKQSSVPRFVYLTTKGKTGWKWRGIKAVYSEEFFLHFLCEAGCGESKMHEVEEQLGISLKQLKNWAEKLAPILDWTLKIAFVAAKVAGTVVLPGLGVILPNTSNDVIRNEGMMTSGIADLLKICSDAGVYNPPELNMSEAKEKELRGAARVAVRKLLEQLRPLDFERMVSLRKVRILDNHRATSEVVWVCKKCLTNYGNRAEEV